MGISITTVLYCILIAAWIVSSAYYLIKTIVVSLCIVYIRRTGFPAKDRYIRLCEETAGMLGMNVPSVIQHPVVRGTFVCGFINPAIVLPCGTKERFMATREVVLHEYAHLARHDTLWNLACQFALILVPVQPLISTLLKKVNEVNDYACDDYVLAYGGNRHSFATQLFNISKTYSGGIPEAAVGSAILSNSSPLYDRIERILDTSCVGIIKVRAFEIVTVIVFSFSSLTLTGFVGFKGDHTGGKHVKLPLQPDRQHIERIITHVPTALADQGMFSPDIHGVSTLQTSKDEFISHTSIPSDSSLPSYHAAVDEKSPFIDSPERSEKRNTIEPETIPLAVNDTFDTQTDINTIDKSYEEATSADTDTPEKLSPTDFQPLNTNLFKQAISENVVTGSEVIGGQDVFAFHDQGYNTIRYHEESNSPVEPGKVNVVTQWDKRHFDYSEKVTFRDELDWHLSRGQKYPIMSPDGSLIAFTDWSGCGIWTQSLRGHTSHLAFADNKTLKSEEYGFEYVIRGQHKQPICFTNDGHEITFRDEIYDESRGSRAIIDEYGDLRSISGYIPVIRSVNIDTGECRTIVEEAWNGCWHPDGRFFIFTRTGTKDSGEKRKVAGISSVIMVLDTLTGKERKLIENAHSPCITPDGDQVIYIESSLNNPQLYIVPFEGGDPEQLTTEGYWHQPACSPDGAWVMGLVYDSTLPYDEDTWFRAVSLENGSVQDFHPPEEFIFATMGNISKDGANFCYHLLKNWESDEFDKYDCHLYIGDFPGYSIEKTTDAETETPMEFAIKGSYPNPFNMNTTIEFVLDTGGSVTVEIFNIMGQRIRTLADETMASGMHSVRWDGTNDDRQRVATGTYIARLKMNSRMVTHPMMLVK